MNLSAILIVGYFAIGLVAMTTVFARKKKGERSDSLLPVGGDPVGAGLLIFVLLFWPLWLIREMTKEDGSK